MGRYRKKPIEILAFQWYKNGDHPKDDNGIGTEGKVVRYFRTPDNTVGKRCEKCSGYMAWHGWIDTLEGGHIVCPGDWIITGVEGEHYPCKPDIFDKTYEEVEGKHDNRDE